MLEDRTTVRGDFDDSAFWRPAAMTSLDVTVRRLRQTGACSARRNATQPSMTRASRVSSRLPISLMPMTRRQKKSYVIAVADSVRCGACAPPITIANAHSTMRSACFSPSSVPSALSPHGVLPRAGSDRRSPHSRGATRRPYGQTAVCSHQARGKADTEAAEAAAAVARTRPRRERKKKKKKKKKFRPWRASRQWHVPDRTAAQDRRR